MLPKLNLTEVSKLITCQVDNVTCEKCCKYYAIPETADCGHTLCHTCWHRLRTCPICKTVLDKNKLKVNIVLQTLTKQVQNLCEIFDIQHHVRLDLHLLQKVDAKDDPNKNVSDWLTNSQNHFSIPPPSSQQSLQEVFETRPLCTSKIVIHPPPENTNPPDKKKNQSEVLLNTSPICLLTSQKDWDKIETISETEDRPDKDKENIVGPMDIEPYVIDDNAYTSDHPRRSCRNKELKSNASANTCNMPLEKQSSFTDSLTYKKTSKSKNDWNNVKKMKKEFNKLNKKNKNKLNVSIEMCKKDKFTKNIINSATSDIKSSKNTEKTNNTSLNKHNSPPQEKNTVQFSTENNRNKFYTYDLEPEKDNCENVVRSNNSNKSSELTMPKPLEEKNNLEYLSNNRIIKGKDKSKIPFFKKSALQKSSETDRIEPTPKTYNIHSNVNSSGDDIIITIKVGTTVTNITINKQQDDIKLKFNADQQVQASLGSNTLKKIDASTSMTQNIVLNNVSISVENECLHNVPSDKKTTENKQEQNIVNKSNSTKKQTASADTATAQFEITESVEKEMSDIMEVVEFDNVPKKTEGTIKTQTQKTLQKKNSKLYNTKSNQPSQEIDLNDQDLFCSGILEKSPVALLKSSKSTPSEVFISTIKSNKLKTQKPSEKRERQIIDIEEELEEAPSKKQKTKDQVYDTEKKILEDQGSEPITYDLVMGQVFTNIDSDMQNANTAVKPAQASQENVKISNTQNLIEKTQNPLKYQKEATILKEVTKSIHTNEKYSENVFSIIDKDVVNDQTQVTNKTVPGPETQKQLDNLLTPRMCHDLISTHNCIEIDQTERNSKDYMKNTPSQDPEVDDSESIVEETPQKNASYSSKNLRTKSNEVAKATSTTKGISIEKEKENSIISLTDSAIDCNDSMKKNITVASTMVLETPQNITKFVDHIVHNSTPFARKSLNFNNDLDQTLCPSTSQIARNTQEKEFLSKAFEDSPKTPLRKQVLMTKNVRVTENRKLYVMGSCLTPVETANLRKLCINQGWKYVDKYVKELTHLIVGVDEDNKSQRTVKYMCALAAGKWIVSCKWVDKCLKTNTVAPEEPYEVLDWTGNPGPRLSRTTTNKLFEGFTFFCMPPFSLLDVETLELMLEAAGGRVVKSAREARAGAEPALLLAEPEHEHDNKFTYMAMELHVVPVNFEWVLNSLGCYSLGSIQELLLCPSTILPPATSTWPSILFMNDSETEHD